MTRPSLQNRSTVHRRRGFTLGGVVVPVVPVAATPTPKAILPAPNPDRPKDTTTTAAIPDNPLSLVPDPILSRLGLTTLSTSSVSSASTVPATPSTSSNTSSLPTTHSSIPITTSTTPHVVHTATRLDPPLTSTLTSMPTHSPSTTAAASGGMSTVTLVGGIAGALGATILLTVIVAFFLRRWRKKAAFDADEFRRSAALLDGNEGRPRPPTMIERKNLAPMASVSPPSAAYPYSDRPTTPLSSNEHAQSYAQHGANTAQYGAIPFQPPSFAAGNGFNGNDGAQNSPVMYQTYAAVDHRQGSPFAAYAGPGQGHEQPGYGAPPVPGIHGPGAYASYGIDPRYPHSQRYPRPQQYQNQQQPQQYQHGFSQDTASLNRQESVLSLANPFSPLPVLKNLEPIRLESPSTSTSTASSNSELSRGPSVVTRQTHDAPPAYINNDGYINMKRDVKTLPTPPLSVVNGSSDSAVPDATTTAGTTTTTESDGRARRPLTVYDDDEVYGGM